MVGAWAEGGSTATIIPLGHYFITSFQSFRNGRFVFQQEENKIFIETVMYKCISSVVIIKQVMMIMYSLLHLYVFE